MTCSCNSVDEFLCQQKANLQAKKDKISDWLPEDIELVVQAEMEYGNSLGQVD